MKRKDEKKIILFDFDGVIVDSFELAFKANKTIRPNLTKRDYFKCFEGNIFEEFQKLNKKRTSDSKRFFRIYIPKLFKLPVINGIPKILKLLAIKYRLIVISSTISSPIREWLDKHNLADYFIEIMGADVHKSKIEKIKMVFKKYKVGVNDCVFITDTLGDILEAKNAGLNSLAVTYGFHSKNILDRGNPAGFIKTPQDIPIEIEKYFKKYKNIMGNKRPKILTDAGYEIYCDAKKQKRPARKYVQDGSGV